MTPRMRLTCYTAAWTFTGLHGLLLRLRCSPMVRHLPLLPPATAASCSFLLYLGSPLPARAVHSVPCRSGISPPTPDAISSPTWLTCLPFSYLPPGNSTIPTRACAACATSNHTFVQTEKYQYKRVGFSFAACHFCRGGVCLTFWIPHRCYSVALDSSGGGGLLPLLPTFLCLF